MQEGRDIAPYRFTDVPGGLTTTGETVSGEELWGLRRDYGDLCDVVQFPDGRMIALRNKEKGDILKVLHLGGIMDLAIMTIFKPLEEMNRMFTEYEKWQVEHPEEYAALLAEEEKDGN